MKLMNYLTAFAAAAMLLGSCTKGLGWEEEQNGSNDPDSPQLPTSGELVLTTDKDEIEADGQDFAQLTLTMDGVEIPANLYKVYEDIDGKSVLIDNISEGKYKSNKLGPHKIKAYYHKQSNMVEIRVKKPSGNSGGDTPGPVDPDGDKLNFKRRVLMIQFTGTQCGYCPYMINMLKEMMTDSYAVNNAILVAAHNYNSNDPAFLNQALYGAVGVSSFPTLNFDMYTNSQQYVVSYNIDVLKSCLARVDVRGGIAANAAYNSETRQVTIAAQVKAAEESEFRIGAMLIEDKIIGTQYNKGAPGNWTNFEHNNSIRYIDGQYSSNSYTGHDLGVIAKGGTANYTFTIDVKGGWKAENCRLVLYITTPEKIGSTRKFYVNNAISMPLTGEKSYEYTE